MRGKREFSAEEKRQAIARIEEGAATLRSEASRLGVYESTIQLWMRNYEAFGMDGLKRAQSKEKYNKSQKEAAVLEYLSGVGSLRKICQRHRIRSIRLLHVWVTKYTGHERMNAPRTGRRTLVTKGRKTTRDERMEIVKYCMEQGLDYISAAMKYQVSYQQVYQWVKKYEEKGAEGLVDRRGRRKPEDARYRI